MGAEITRASACCFRLLRASCAERYSPANPKLVPLDDSVTISVVTRYSRKCKMCSATFLIVRESAVLK